MDSLPSLVHPPLTVPITTPSLVYSVPLIATNHTLDPPTLLDGTNDVAPPNTMFHDVSFFGSLRREDAASVTGFDGQGSVHPGKHRPGSWECWKNAIGKGFTKEHGAKGVPRERQIPGCNPELKK